MVAVGDLEQRDLAGNMRAELLRSSTPLPASANDRGRAMGTDSGVTNQSYQVDKFTNMKSMNDEDGPYFVHRNLSRCYELLLNRLHTPSL